MYTNFWIALLSTLFTAEYYFFNNIPINYTVLSLVFFSTLFVYNTLRLKKNSSIHTKNTHLKWVENHLRLLTTLTLLSIVIVFYVFAQLNNSTSQLTLVVLGIISLWYGIPFSKKLPELRIIPFIKVFLIGGTYASVAVIIPFLESKSVQFSLPLLLFFIAQLFYIIAITIPFDVRDSITDKEAGIKTIPILLSVKKAQYIAIVCLTISTLLIGSLLIEKESMLAHFINGITYLYTLIVIQKTTPEKPFLFSALAVEGSMLLHFLIFI